MKDALRARRLQLSLNSLRQDLRHFRHKREEADDTCRHIVDQINRVKALARKDGVDLK